MYKRQVQVVEDFLIINYWENKKLIGRYCMNTKTHEYEAYYAKEGKWRQTRLMGLCGVNPNDYWYYSLEVALDVYKRQTWIRYRKPDISMTLNGSLAGLVAITAGCDVVSPTGAFFIGIIAAFIVVFGIEFIDKVCRIDDPVGAVGVHCLCGAAGTLLTGLFALDGGVFYGGGFHMLAVQFTGVVAVIAWVTVTMIITFQLLKHTIGPVSYTPLDVYKRPHQIL